MVHSKVASLTGSMECGVGLIDDGDIRASIPTFEPGWVDGLRSPSIRSSISQIESNCEAVLRDPEAILRGLLSCDVDMATAASMVMKYYEAASSKVIAVRDQRDLSAVGSTMSARAIRTEKWRDEMAAMPLRDGFCYLWPVRYARRGHVAAALRKCPSMCDFVSHIVPEDIDDDLSRKINVYKLPTVPGSNFVAYHLAERCEEGVCVGSFRAVLQSLLHSYPWLNRHDFGCDQVLPMNLPITGKMVVHGEYLSAVRSSVREDCKVGVVHANDLPLVGRVGALPGRCQPSLDVSHHDSILRDRRDRFVALAASTVVGHMPPVVHEGGAGFLVRDGIVTLFVDMSFVDAGQTVDVSVPGSGAVVWLYEPESVVVVSDDNDIQKLSTDVRPSRFVRQFGHASRDVKLMTVRPTMQIKIRMDLGDHDYRYLWRALTQSCTRYMTAVDASYYSQHELEIRQADRSLRFSLPSEYVELPSILACLLRATTTLYHIYRAL